MKMNRREFFQQLPFALLFDKKRAEAAEVEPDQVSPEVIALLNIVSQNSELRDQALLHAINVLRVKQGLPEISLGHYGTIYGEESESEDQ